MGRLRSWAAVLLPVLALASQGCHEETVTTPTLSATCAANPSAGTAPLRVTFTLDVAGAAGAFTVAVDYGDGTQGSDPAQAHVYATGGSFSPSFTVNTASQSARCSATVTVVSAPPTPTPTPSPTVNQRPQVIYITVPAANGSGTITGTAPLTVNFNLCRTSDPEHDTLRFQMDLDGNGTFEYLGSTGVDCRHAATYAAGTHAATICATDIDCQTWPACFGNPQLHPLQCRTFPVVATP
jgi:PKD repeat protein